MSDLPKAADAAAVPPKRTRILQNFLVVLLLALSVQFIAKVYAMAFTLSSSTTESKARRDAIIGDFDGDGDLDYVAGNTDGTNTYRLDLYTNNSAGTFSNGVFGTSTDFVRFSAGDIDGDGDLDVVSAHNTALYKHVNNGAGSFAQYTIATGQAARINIALLDADLDGDLDFVSYDPTQAVYINDGHGNFSAAASTIRGMGNSLVVADFTSDGYPDLAFADSATTNVVYKNSGTGAFVQSWSSGNSSADPVSMAVGDLDNDGDIDLLITDANGIVIPTLNNGLGTNFTSGTQFGNVTTAGGIAVGDVDNDGDLDAILADNDSGAPGGGNQIWLNNGSAVFTQSGTPTEQDDCTRAVPIGDIDNDGDLDYIAANSGCPVGGAVNRHYKNDQAATSPNTAPAAPSSLTAVKVSDNGSTATVRLSWGSGSDTQTATRLLQYQVQVGTGTTTSNIVPGKTVSPNWVSRVLPNGQSRTYLVKNLVCRTGLTYYWSVSTVDTGFKSAGASQKTFTLDSSCNFTDSSPPPPPPPLVGGGLSAKYFHTNEKPPEPPAAGTIMVFGFDDLDGNGTKSAREQYAFKGLPFTASGRTAEDLAVRKTLKLDDKGQIAFQLPPSDDRGYWINVDTGSTLLVGYEPTGKTSSGGYVLRSGTTLSANFGFRREDLLAYRPCLAIGSPEADEVPGIDAFILMERLQDSFGHKTMRDVELSGDLVKRKVFFTLLERMQCVARESDAATLQKKLRQVFGRREPPSFVDLPLNVRVADSLLAYSLLAAGADVSRATSIGPAADLQSPITRREAIRAVVSLLPISASGSLKTSGTLPTDLDPNDPLVPDFLTLQKLGILPESFLPILGANQGVDVPETAILLARAAFAAGKIHLLPEVATKPKGKPAAPIATFLQELPALKARTCLEKDQTRAAGITFKDVLPGDPLYFDLRELLTHGSRGGDKKMLWLTAATRRPTEFGIVRGQTKAALMEPVTVLETIRDLLVLACLPPDLKIDVASGKKKSGAEGTLAVKDKISDLPRDASFASRVLYRAQDGIREFNLSLFTYAPHLLRLPPRSPTAGLSVEEATDLLASGLLMIQVRTKAMSPQDGEKTFATLSAAIRRDLLGKDVNWRDAAILKNTPFTRGMLLQFFATVLLNRTTVPVASTPPPIPLGEIWWERIR